MQRAYRTDVDYYTERAAGLLASAEDGTPAAVAAFARHGMALDSDGSRAVLAREHGLGTWNELTRHVEHVDTPFARAYRAIEARDLDGLPALLDQHPEVVREIGTNGNDLLGLAAGTCDERLCRVLLDHGADPARANVHGWTPLHQAAYSALPHLARMLLDAGAPTDVPGRGDGGTPLVVALFWGHREVAGLLAEHGLAPANLRVGAGLGRLDIVEDPGAHRGFYRPHSGFPRWRASDDPTEILDEALAWAARNGRAETLEALVGRGAHVDADVYRGTALVWATWTGHVDAVRTLLGLGADVNHRGTFGGPGHGQGVTALHLAAQMNHLEVIPVLLDGGADATIEDDLFHAGPLGWAEFFEHPEAAELVRASGSSPR